MAKRFADIAFTPSVRAVQDSMGSRQQYTRVETDAEAEVAELGTDEIEFIAKRDSFYMSSVSETDWPYVQHRGGPAGFLKVLSPTTLGFADYRGNRQYVSVGHFLKNDRVAMILVDYPNRTRLKIPGRTRLAPASDAEVLDRLNTSDHRARVERGFLIQVAAFDWNCPQHITPRFTEAEVLTTVAPLRKRLAQLEGELIVCKERTAGAK